MTLKTELKTLDGVAESIHEYYVKGDDDTYRLDIDGMPDVSGLKSALEKERRDAKKYKDQVAVFDGFDPADLQGLKDKQVDLEELEKLRNSSGTNKEKIEEMVNARVMALNETHTAAINERDTAVGELRGKLSKYMVDDVILKSAAKTGAHPEAMDDILRRGREVFKIVDDKLTPMKGDDVLYGSDGLTPLSVDSFITDLATSAGHLFKGSSGGGAANDQGGGGAKHTITARDQLPDGKAKAAFIGKHGQTAFLELPATTT